jgi:hypothetical protein
LDIKVFILTVVENSGICKCNRIYFIEFENIKKSNEITLLAHRVAISFNIYQIRFYVLSQIETTRSRVTRLILTLGQMYN